MATKTKLTFAFAAALTLLTTAFAGTAAAATGAPGADAPTTDEAEISSVNCLQFYKEYEVGPVTIVIGCGGGSSGVDTTWRPDTGLSLAQDDSSPSDQPVRCILDDYDEDHGIFFCLFGQPW